METSNLYKVRDRQGSENVYVCIGVRSMRRDTTDYHRGRGVSDATQVEVEEDLNGGRWIQQS